MATNNKINFEVGFITNSKGLKELKSELNEIRSLASSADFTAAMDPSKIQAMVKSANDLEYAMNAAFDVDLNTVNIQKFNQILKQSGTDLSTIQQNLAAAGTEGQAAFLKATAGLMQFNNAARQTNHFLDSIATSFANTIKWSAMSSIINTISGTIQKSYYYVKDLDTALNDIRIVTGKNADEMSRFAESANEAAKALAVTTEDYTKGSLIYYQQGLDDKTVKTLTDITAKTSNVTGQSMSAVSEELTAVWNGYQVANEAAKEGMQVYEQYVDKMAAVGASTASDLEELSKAMSKVASAASAMGVDFDDLNAQIATIVSVTRQAPESVGTALKTIYARLGDLKVDGVDEFGTTLGEVSEQLKVMGIEVVDTQGNMRSMTNVMAEVAEKWNTWTEAQRQAAAVAMAGKRQYNNLIALFDNWEMYGDALKTSMEAAGTLEKQQGIALDSLSNKMDTLKATAEDLYDSLYDENDIKSLVEGLTGIVQVLADFSDSIGGLINLIPMLGSTAARVFSNQIANGLSTIIINAQNARRETQMMADNAAQLKAMFSDSSLYANTEDADVSGAMQQGIRQLEQYYSEMQQYQGIMSADQKETYNHILNNIAKVGELNLALEKNADTLKAINDKWAAQGKLVEEVDIKEQDQAGLKKRIDNLTKLNSVYNALTEKQSLGFFETDDKDAVLEVFETLKKDANIDTTGLEKVQKRFEQLKDSGAKIPNIINNIIDDLKRAGATEGEIVKLTQQMKNLRDGTNEAGNSLKNNLDLQQFISGITNTIGQIGQLATSIRTLGNLANVVFDDSISNGEKVMQIITNLGFALPILVNSLSALRSTLVAINVVEAASFAVRKADLLIVGAITKKKVEDAVITKILGKAEDETTKGIAARVAANNYSIDTLDAETRAKLLNEYATLEDKAAIDKATTSTLGWNAALAMNPIIAVTAAVIALTAALYLYNKAQEKIREKENEIAQQHIDKENQLQEEIKSHQEAYNSYMQLYNAYKEGKATKDEMKEATDNLTEAYGKEIDALGALADSYDAVADSIKAKREEEINEGIESAKREKSNAEVQVSNAARSNATGIKSIHLDSGATTKDDEAVVNAFNNAVGSEVLKKGAFGYEYDIALNFSNPEQIVGVYDNLSQVVSHIEETLDPEEYLNSEIYMQAKEWIDSMTESVEALKQAEEDLAEYSAELTTLHIDYSDVDNLNAYNQALETTKAAIAKETDLELGKDDKRLTALAQKYMEMQNASLSLFRQQQAAIEQLKESGNWLFTDEGYKNLFNKYSAEEISLVANFAVDEEVTEANFDEYLQKAKVKYAEEIITVSFDAATDMQNKIRSGDLTAENAEEDESFKTLTQNLDALTAAYPELTAEAELLNHTWLIGTQEYSEALEAVQDKLYELDLQKAYDEVGTQIDEFLEKYGKDSTVNIDADASEFEEEMEKILQAEYEIDVKIHAEAENEFNSIEHAFDDIHDKAELIGDDFKVSASNLRELNNAFPGIIDGMKILGDGTVQLNEQIVQSAMEAAEAEAQADAEATYAKLEDQAKLLRAKQATYQSMAEIALELANTEVEDEDKATQLRGELSDQLTYLKELNSADAATSEQDDNAAVADSSNVNAKQVADNWRSAFEVMANSSLAAAEAAIKNMNAVASRGATGTSGKVDLSDYQYTGGGGTTGESKIVEQVQNIIKGNSEEQQKNAAKLAEQLFAMADASGKAANDIEGMMAQIAARGTGLDKELVGVASGLGSNGKKDKSKSGSKKEHKEDEVNRYWEIEKALDKITDALKKVDKLKSHVFGKQKIQVLNQEAKLIKQQTKLYEQLYEEQKKEAEELRSKLSAGGMTFNAEGEITNYGEALKSALATYNQAVDQFNAGLINDEGFKIAEQNYENFKKNVDRYDKLFYSEMKETREKIEEEVQKLRDIELEKFEIKLQIKIDKAQLRKDFRNFRKEMEKDFTLTYEILPKTKEYKQNFKDDKSQVNSYIKAAQEIQKEIDIIMAGGQSKMFASLSEAQEKLKEVNEKFQEASRNTMQDVEDAWNNYIALIDQTNEKLDDQIERYDQIQGELEDWKQMIELVYGDKAYDKMDDYYARAKENSLAQIGSLKKISDAWESQFKKALEAEGASIDRTDQWSEDLTKLYQNWINSEDKLRDATNDHIKLLKDDYANTVEGIIDQLDKDLTGGKGLEQMKKEWEETKEYADKYYNSVQKAYHIQTLNNKIQKSINRQSDIKNAQKLEKLRQKELSELRAMSNMSEYDLKVAEAKYDIALKEIALEESRNNKNTMKLSRNAEGNWSYQYVADEDDVEDRQQDLLDAYMNLQNISDEQMGKLMDEGLAAIDNLKEEIRTVYKKAEAEKWSQEKLEQELAALKNKYYGKGGVIFNISEEFEKARREAAESGLAVQAKCYELDEANFENLTIEIKRLFDEANEHLAKGYSEEDDGFEKTFESANETMSKQWEAFLNGEGGIKPKWVEASGLMGEAWVGKGEESVITKVGSAFTQISTKFGNYLTELDKLQETSGIKFKDISGYIKETATQTNNVNKNIKELVKQTKNIEKQRKQVEQLMVAWDKVKVSIDNASKSIEEYLKKQQSIPEPSAPNTPTPSSYSGSDTTNYSSGSGGGSSSYTGGSSNTTGGNNTPYSYNGTTRPLNKIVNGVLIKRTGLNYQKNESYWLVEPISSSGRHGSQMTFTYPGVVDERGGYSVLQAWKKKYLNTTVSYDTGGYTGSWSDNNGRLATLHQKELVLNAQDTENFLAATDSLRDLVSLDSSIEKSISEAISKMLIHMANANLNNATIPNNNETNTNNIFNINAEFPNANDVTEIREAILSLPNLASQYMHKTGY